MVQDVMQTMSTKHPSHKRPHFFPTILNLQEVTWHIEDDLQMKHSTHQTHTNDESNLHQLTSAEVIQLAKCIVQESNLPRDFVALHPSMQAIKKQLKRLVGDCSPIAIVGENGVGKRHLARWIHQNNSHRLGYFYDVNCEELSEREVVAFFEIAFNMSDSLSQQFLREATIHIHHFDALSIHIQQQIMNWVWTTDKTLKIRLIISLRQSVQESYAHSFISEEVASRVGHEFHLRSLHERSQEIVAFVNLFLKQLSQREMCQRFKIEKDALEILKRYTWPGNITELKHVLNHFVITQKYLITKEAVMGILPNSFMEEAGLNLTSLADAEKMMIKKTLAAYGATLEGKKMVAESLKISLSTLYNKMKIYDLT